MPENDRVPCKNTSCSQKPLKIIADEKRGYCIQCFPANNKCADNLPRVDKKAHRLQYPKNYGLNWTNIFDETLLALFLIIAGVVKFVVLPYIDYKWWNFLSECWAMITN